MAGYVYVVENENHKVKIGQTINPDRRIATLETQGGYRIVSRYVTKELYQYSQLELFLHDKFREYRDVGEWFNCEFSTVKEYVDTLDIDEWNKPPTNEEIAEHERRIESLKELFSTMIYGGGIKFDTHDINQYKSDELDEAIDDMIDKIKFLIDGGRECVDILSERAEIAEEKLLNIEERYPDIEITTKMHRKEIEHSKRELDMFKKYGVFFA